MAKEIIPKPDFTKKLANLWRGRRNPIHYTTYHRLEKSQDVKVEWGFFFRLAFYSLFWKSKKVLGQETQETKHPLPYILDFNERLANLIIKGYSLDQCASLLGLSSAALKKWVSLNPALYDLVQRDK